MAELTTDPTPTSACCAPETQATCCEPSEKEECCGTSAATGSCGCADGQKAEAAAPAGSEDIRETVREKYAAATRAAAEQQGSASCCGPIALTDADHTPVFGATLYADAETDGATASAVAASLGCGVPTAVADLHEGETVLDLGSGAGADVLISARRVGPTGKAIGLDMTDEMLELARANAADAGRELLMTLPAPDTLPALEWGRWDTRYLFFTGKGGVGKTTIASAIALALADAGKRTLVISTDPASNLDDVFGISARPEPTPVPGAPDLFVSNLDPEATAEAFKERAVGPYRGVLPQSAIDNMGEQLSGACTVEIAAFNEFTAVLTAPQAMAEFDHIVFDTAPTGHTLRLLTLPRAWSGYVAEHPAGASCLGPLAGLDQQREQYAAAVRTLADPVRTTLILVTRAETSALREAARASGELAALGVANRRLVINGLLHDHQDDPTASAFAERQAAALTGAPPELASMPVAGVGLVAGDVTGIAALRAFAGSASAMPADAPEAPSIDLPGLSELVDELDDAGNGVILTMGKGGVGKTTLASAIAVALVDRGHEVTLSTTDPAAHLTDALADAAPGGLLVERIDPAVETARYTAEVLDAATGLDDEGRGLLEEDLRSPCTEEVAVFRAFARTVDAARERIVVLDTAPTGHTLLLLDAAQSYQREVQRTSAEVPAEVSELLARLRDPTFARMLVVTLAESTPVHEADRLQADLRRAGIEPYGWIINASLATSGTTHPTLRARAAAELTHIDQARQLSSQETWLVGWQPDAPVGAHALRQLTMKTPVGTR